MCEISAAAACVRLPACMGVIYFCSVCACLSVPVLFPRCVFGDEGLRKRRESHLYSRAFLCSRALSLTQVHPRPQKCFTVTVLLALQPCLCRYCWFSATPAHTSTSLLFILPPLLPRPSCCVPPLTTCRYDALLPLVFGAEDCLPVLSERLQYFRDSEVKRVGVHWG